MKVKKPKKHRKKPEYNWNEIVKYLEAKYNIELRGYKKEEPPRKGEIYSHSGTKKPESSDDYVYRDFWHHLIDIHEIHNGCSICIEPNGWIPYLDKPQEWWIKEIYELLLKEFGEEIDIYVDW